MAGSRVSDAATVTSTASTTVNANPFMAGWPISRMPSIETTTVIPANRTARPAVPIAVEVAPSGVLPGGEAAAVAGDDEQGVVDADAEADHGRGRRRPVGDVDHPPEDLAERHRDPEPEQCGDQRQPHRHDGAEGDQQDDRRPRRAR